MLGMGSLEILVILLISFLLLGPQKMISGARMLGDLMAEAKRFAQQIPHVDVDGTLPTADKEDFASSSASEDAGSDLDVNYGGPIAFDSRRKRKVSLGQNDMEAEESLSNREVGNEDASGKSSLG